MISFEYLNKPDFSALARQIFDILADNMTIIAPTGNSREEDFGLWSDAVSDGLQREERQIILIKDSETIVGFFQYYTNADTFMMEEIQFRPEYQGKGIGRKIVEMLEQDEFFLRAKRIEIPSSITASEFYRKLGYDYKNGVRIIDEEHHIPLEKFR